MIQNIAHRPLAYQEGYKAALNYEKPLASNPYGREDMFANSAWHDGWCDGCRVYHHYRAQNIRIKNV